MMRTVEAEIRPDGTVRLLEPVEIKQTTRALVTVVETGVRNGGNVLEMLEFLRAHRLPEGSRRSQAEIEASIHENREAWD